MIKRNPHEESFVNAYDFDGTIFPSNCTIGFAIWCMNRHPKLYFAYAPRAVLSVVLYKLGKKPSYLMLRDCTVT